MSEADLLVLLQARWLFGLPPAQRDDDAQQHRILAVRKDRLGFGADLRQRVAFEENPVLNYASTLRKVDATSIVGEEVPELRTRVHITRIARWANTHL